MNSFLFRDARKQLIQEAVNAIGEQPSDLLKLLQQELAALQAEDWTVSDRTYYAVGADWLWSIRLTLKGAVDDDPALLALGRTAQLSDAQAGAIETLPHFPGNPPNDYLDQVRAAVDNDESIFSELLFAAHRRWIVQPAEARDYPFDDVAVLLPLRLETLFDEPTSTFNDHPTRWKLSLRVIPDEASICRDNHFVSGDELKMVTAFWNAIQQPGAPEASWLDGDKAAVAWQQLSAQVTPARATWLVANLPATQSDESIIVTLPPDMPDKPQPNRVGGFPPELFVTVNLSQAVAGEFRKSVGRLPMDEAQMIDSSRLTLPLPSRLEDERTRWWSDWNIAKEIGVAGEWLLPEGVNPKNIDALYVVGIGDETPQKHFRAQVDAGEMAILPLGVPTNTVQGKAAADLGKNAADWRKIAQQRLRQSADANPNLFSHASANLQLHLLGEVGNLPFFPTGDIADDTLDSQRMSQALWPALWGHWLTEIWKVGDNAFRMGKWMSENFFPEGPLMPLRIGDQPYGILPVTQLSAWQTPPTFTEEDRTQAAVEDAMANALTQIRSEWQALVKDKRSVVHKNNEEFMQLLGQNALSRRYLQREFSPAWTQLAPYINAMGLDINQQQAFLERALERYKLPIDFIDSKPAEIWLTNGYWWQHELPLVQPSAMLYQLGGHFEKERVDLPELFIHLFEGVRLDIIFEEFRYRALPDSLLIRLLIYAAQLVVPWRQNITTTAEQVVVQAQEKGLFRIAKELDQEAWRNVVEDVTTGEVRRFTMNIPEVRRKQLERALRATLDSAATRIDPWITGFAWQRLKVQSSSPRHSHRLGVYGWVEGPFEGKPGPTNAGRLHTPSYNQTLAALILRDKFLTADRATLTNDAGQNPWAMNLSSAKVRLAEEIADEVRMGFHIYEIVGRHVENIIGAHEQVKMLRIHPQYAMRSERKDPNEVCNGIAALLGLLAGDGDFPLLPEQTQALKQLHAALDSYSDLLVADGVMQLVNRQTERAAETLDAAAGFTRPPSFEYLRTPPSGYQLESLVISSLPYLPTDDAETSPIRLAEPSFTAYLDNLLSGDWIWRAEDAAGGDLGSVSLETLGFVPHETIALSEGFFSELAGRKLGLDKTAKIIAPRQLTMAQELASVLGNRPAAGRDFTSDVTIQRAADPAIYEELRNRFQRLQQQCSSLIEQLQNAADDDSRTALILQAIRWGVMPTSETADRESLFALLLGQPVPESATQLSILATNMGEVLRQRLNSTPEIANVPPSDNLLAPLENHADLQRIGTPDGIASLARAIATLAAPNSKLAVLACWDRTQLLESSKLATAESEESLEESWLTVISATRPPLARLEALQLEMEMPLIAWSNSQGDPWQKQLIATNRAMRETAHEKQLDESPLGLRTSRFVASYGIGETWMAEKVAVGMIDAFSEAIPMPQRTSTAAFGFNAPSARAPQAILLAVPPLFRQRIDAPLLREIVAEARQSAHARMTRIEDLGDFYSLTPTMWLQSSGENRIHLEPYPIFE